MLSGSMYGKGARPSVKIARVIGNSWAAMERITRRPVSGLLRDRTITSTSGSSGSALRSLRLSSRRTNG